MRWLVWVCAIAGGMAPPASAVERAGYDSYGRIVSLLSESGEAAVHSDYVVVTPDGKRMSLLERRVGTGPRSQGQLKSWAGSYGVPERNQFHIEWKAEDTADGLRYNAVVAPEAGEFRSLEFVLDVAREVFVQGRLTVDDRPPLSLPQTRPDGAALFQGKARQLRFENAAARIAVTVSLDSARELNVADRWDLLGAAHIVPGMPLDEGGQSGTMYYAKTRRSYQIRIPLLSGSAPAGKAELSATFALTDKSQSPPVRLSVDASAPRYAFDGFGANFCWDNGKGNRAIQQHMLENLKIGWARTEMKLRQWDEQRENGPDVRYDLETMRRLQTMGVPYVISVWRLPSRFYAETEPPGARGHSVNPARWGELVDLIGSYLLYAKRELGVEPDLFSFNEANLGVDVRFTPEEHTAQIKRMGAAFRAMGLKTRMLLGDAVPARDSHVYALDAAADSEALQYVGAIAFHSWGGAAPQQYAAWSDLAQWLRVPLLVTELGVDSAAYATNAWDTWQYGLREAWFTQEMLLYARPQGTQFWQFTDDYALAHIRPDGSVEPTPRYWLMKHFTDLTPMKSELIATASDQGDVLVTAFRKGTQRTVHIVNRGGARDAKLTGVSGNEWLVFESAEAGQYRRKAPIRAKDGDLTLRLPPRSLVTLTTPATQ